jgi:radical SAM superfamily enzyme YgiQ (UPF0313 family)
MLLCSPETCLPFFDAICVGVAEPVWKQLLIDVQKNRLQKKYSELFEGEDIASPQYATIDKRKYLFSNVVLTSRGCPNRCDFCYNSNKNRYYVQRPIKDVLNDIRILGTKHILFIDDNFIGNPGYTYSLLRHLKNLELKWNAAVTTKIMDYPDLLDLMAETGCQSLFIGFESINAASLADVHKDNIVEKYETLVTAIHDRGIMINASMVFGLDGDTPEVFQDTLDWLVKNKIETLTSHILTPYPGTVLYERMKQEGRITDDNLSKYNTAHVVFSPKNMTAEELQEGYLWMYKKFYSFRNIIKRMPVNQAQRKPYVLFNLFYRKFGAVTSFLSRIIPMHKIGKWATRVSYKLGK